MKVLYITNNYPTPKNPDYGVFTKDQIDNLKKQGIDGDILFINARENGIKEYYIAFKKIKLIYQNYNLIHCFHGLTLITAFFSTRKKKILISFLNEIKYENFKNNYVTNSFFVLIYNILIQSSRVFTIFKDKIPKRLSAKRHFFFLPNGVDLDVFYPIDKHESCKNLNIDESKKYILFVASKNKMRSQKRYDIFKSTIEHLKLNYPIYNFEELIMSNVPREMCIYYYNVSSVHLLTSNYEGSPNSVKEAMGCNIPIVSTDVGNVRQMLKGTSNCYISDQQPETLAGFVLQAINAPKCDLRNILIKNKLTSEQKTVELIEIYKKIIVN